MTIPLAPLVWTLLCAVGIVYALARLRLAWHENRLAHRFAATPLRLALTGADVRAAVSTVVFLWIYFAVGVLALSLSGWHETGRPDWVSAGIALGLLAGLLLYVADLVLRARADDHARGLARRGGGEG